MKSRKVSFNETAGTCDCGAPLKRNLVNRKSGRVVCFTCWRIAQSKRNHIMATGREVRQHPELRSQKRWDKMIPLRSVR